MRTQKACAEERGSAAKALSRRGVEASLRQAQVSSWPGAALWLELREPHVGPQAKIGKAPWLPGGVGGSPVLIKRQSQPPPRPHTTESRAHRQNRPRIEKVWRGLIAIRHSPPAVLDDLCHPTACCSGNIILLQRCSERRSTCSDAQHASIFDDRLPSCPAALSLAPSSARSSRYCAPTKYVLSKLAGVMFSAAGRASLDSDLVPCCIATGAKRSCGQANDGQENKGVSVGSYCNWVGEFPPAVRPQSNASSLMVRPYRTCGRLTQSVYQVPEIPLAMGCHDE